MQGLAVPLQLAISRIQVATGRLQSQYDGGSNTRAMVILGRKAQVLARSGRDVLSGNYPFRRRKIRLALTSVAKTAPSPGQRKV